MVARCPASTVAAAGGLRHPNSPWLIPAGLPAAAGHLNHDSPWQQQKKQPLAATGLLAAAEALP